MAPSRSPAATAPARAQAPCDAAATPRAGADGRWHGRENGREQHDDRTAAERAAAAAEAEALGAYGLAAQRASSRPRRGAARALASQAAAHEHAGWAGARSDSLGATPGELPAQTFGLRSGVHYVPAHTLPPRAAHGDGGSAAGDQGGSRRAQGGGRRGLGYGPRIPKPHAAFELEGASDSAQRSNVVGHEGSSRGGSEWDGGGGRGGNTAASPPPVAMVGRTRVRSATLNREGFTQFVRASAAAGGAGGQAAARRGVTGATKFLPPAKRLKKHYF